MRERPRFSSPVAPRPHRGGWVLAGVLAAGLWTGGALRAAEPTVAGPWHGVIELSPETRMAVLVRLGPQGDGWKGDIDIPAQNAFQLPLVRIAVEGAQVRFSLGGGIPGDPTFAGTLAGSEIRGTFSQGGVKAPFRLERGTGEPPRRPQEPMPPFPYSIESVSYANGEVQLSGTLTVPPGEGPFPAVLLLTGSGAQDRDQSLSGHKPFWVLADRLSRNGIAVLRVDDRGVGGSGGRVADSTIQDFAQDALAGVRFLKQQRRIAPGRIGLLGHSEGGNVAPLAASQSPDVAFIVLLSGCGVTGREVLYRQIELVARAQGATEAQVQSALQEVRRQTAAAVEGGSRWERSFLEHDPRPALRQVTVPVLALSGSLDLQVPAEPNLVEIEQALRAAGNRDVTARRLPGLNHLFQPAKTGAPAEYGEIETTLDPTVLDLVTGWIRDRFAAPRPATP